MDPKDKEIADLKGSVAALTTQVTTVTGERDAANKKATDAAKERDLALGDVKKLGKDLESKDKIIDDKNKQIIGTRKKFSEMNEKEKDELTPAEKAALQSGEDNAARLERLEKDRTADLERERNSRVESTISKYTSKADIAAKIRENLANLKPFEKAMTVQEIEAAVQTSINMLGKLEPGAINGVTTAPAGAAPGDTSKKDGDFADTAEGQALLAKISPSAVDKPKA